MMAFECFDAPTSGSSLQGMTSSDKPWKWHVLCLNTSNCSFGLAFKWRSLLPAESPRASSEDGNVAQAQAARPAAQAARPTVASSATGHKPTTPSAGSRSAAVREAMMVQDAAPTHAHAHGRPLIPPGSVCPPLSGSPAPDAPQSTSPVLSGSPEPASLSAAGPAAATPNRTHMEASVQTSKTGSPQSQSAKTSDGGLAPGGAAAGTAAVTAQQRFLAETPAAALAHGGPAALSAGGGGVGGRELLGDDAGAVRLASDFFTGERGGG